MDLKKNQPTKGKMNYEDYDLPETKKTIVTELPPNKELTQQATPQQTSNTIRKEIQISQQTKERAEACKLYVESFRFIHFLYY